MSLISEGIIHWEGYMQILCKRLYLTEEESSCFWNLVCVYSSVCVFKIFLLISDVFNIYHAVFAFYTQKMFLHSGYCLTWNLIETFFTHIFMCYLMMLSITKTVEHCSRWVNEWVWGTGGMILPGEWKCSEKNLSQSVLICHQTHMN